MNVLFVMPPEEGELWQTMANAPYAKVRAMPCVIREVTTALEANELSPQMDVFFYSGSRYRHRESAHFIIPDNMLTVNYDGDPYRDLNWSFNKSVDLHLTPVITPFWQSRRNMPAGAAVVWSPGCAELGAYDTERPIDVLLWGRFQGYPFRVFAHTAIMKYYTNIRSQEGHCVFHLKMNINGREFTYTTLDYMKAMRQHAWGAKLYSLIQRSRICIVGSHVYKMALGKYFENAANGALNFTNEFYDSEALGFRHKENIWITNEANFLGDLDYLLSHPDVVDVMRINAWQLIAQRHTVEIRAAELYHTLNDFLKKKRSR